MLGYPSEVVHRAGTRADLVSRVWDCLRTTSSRDECSCSAFRNERTRNPLPFFAALMTGAGLLCAPALVAAPVGTMARRYETHSHVGSFYGGAIILQRRAAASRLRLAGSAALRFASAYCFDRFAAARLVTCRGAVSRSGSHRRMSAALTPRARYAIPQHAVCGGELAAASQPGRASLRIMHRLGRIAARLATCLGAVSWSACINA